MAVRQVLKKLNVPYMPTPILTTLIYNTKRIIQMGKAYGKNEKIAASLEGLVKSIDEVATFANESGEQVLVANSSTLAIAAGEIVNNLPDNELPSQVRDDLKAKLEEIRNTLYPDQELPEGPQTPDQSLPEQPVSPDQSLPETPDTPDQELPPTPAPKV